MEIEKRRGARVTSRELASSVRGRVRVSGWLQAKRALGGVTFYVLRDGWGTMQVVFEANVQVPEIPLESVCCVEGDVVLEPRAPAGVEIRGTSVEVIARAEALPFVLSKRSLDVSLPTLLDHAALSLRHAERRFTFRIADRLMASFRASLKGKGFTEIQTPKLTGGAAEGGANLFTVEYFGEEAYLAQSPQLYKQVMVGVYERVFEVGPVFRAEPHDTARHLNQYTSLDAEMGFIRDHAEVMGLVERVVFDMICAAQAALVEWDQPCESVHSVLCPDAIPAISFTEAVHLLRTRNGATLEDLAPGDEIELARWAREVHQSDFLFVTGFPMRKRPFYTHPDPESPQNSRSFDLLFRGLEIVTGGQRLHTYQEYLQALDDRGMRPESFAGYLDAFRWGMPPHGGFGMGLERVVMKLLGLTNVREAVLFPRTVSRLSP